jgi:hypothetical protein
MAGTPEDRCRPRGVATPAVQERTRLPDTAIQSYKTI